MLFFRINLTKNVAHPVFLMHIQSLLSGYAPGPVYGKEQLGHSSIENVFCLPKTDNKKERKRHKGLIADFWYFKINSLIKRDKKVKAF